MLRPNVKRTILALAFFATALAIELKLLRPMLYQYYGNSNWLIIKVVLGSIAAAVAVGIGCGVLAKRAYYGVMCGLVFGGPFLAFELLRLAFDWGVAGSAG